MDSIQHIKIPVTPKKIRSVYRKHRPFIEFNESFYDLLRTCSLKDIPEMEIQEYITTGRESNSEIINSIGGINKIAFSQSEALAVLGNLMKIGSPYTDGKSNRAYYINENTGDLRYIDVHFKKDLFSWCCIERKVDGCISSSFRLFCPSNQRASN